MACVDGDTDAVREPEFACFGLHPVRAAGLSQPAGLSQVGWRLANYELAEHTVSRPGRSRAAYASGAVLESRSRQPTFPRDPQQANTLDASRSPGGLRMAQGVQVVKKRGKREVRPGHGDRALVAGDRGRWSRKDEVAVAELVPAVAVLARGLVAVLDQLVSGGRGEHLEVR